MNVFPHQCRELEAEIEMLPVFKERYERFMEWADDLERRMDSLQVESAPSSAATAQQVIIKTFSAIASYHSSR